MVALIRKELREIIWVALGFLGVAVVVTGILYLHHWWSHGVAALYSGALGLFVMYMGCEAIAGDGTRGLVEWSYRWPVSRLQWWLVKLLTRWVVTSLVTVPVALAVTWFTVQPQPQATATCLSGFWWLVLVSGGLGLAAPFFASSITRTSLHAFGVTVLLGYAASIAYAGPLILYMLLHRLEFRPPPVYLMVVPWAWSVLALLAASLYAFVTVPILDYAQRAKRALLTAAVLMVPMLVLLVGAEVVGMAIRKPVPQGIGQAQLSPDGRRIAFSDHFAAQSLWLVSADGTNLRRLRKDDPEQIRWLRDSRQLLLGSHIETVQRGPGGHVTRSWNSATGQTQWSVLDTAAAKPSLRPIFQGGDDAYVSPQGKYLLISGQIIEVGSWQARGKVTPPKYMPWLLTWLPDDSAIYVRETGVRGQPRPIAGTGNGPAVMVGGQHYEVLKRIAVPSGEITGAKLPWRSAGARHNHMTVWANPLSQSTVWFHADTSTWTPTPRSQQKVVTRTMDVFGRDGRRVRKAVTYRTNTQKQLLKTTFLRADSGRRFELPGVRPYSDGLSPQARYCLVGDGERPGHDEGAVPQKVALVDLAAGRAGRWFTLPATTWTDRVEGPVWSSDERWLALLVERRQDRQRDCSLIFLSVAGEMRTVQPGTDLGAFGGDGLVGWTPAGEFIVQRGEKELVALTPQGHERIIVQAHGWLVDRMEGARKAQSAPPQRGK